MSVRQNKIENDHAQTVLFTNIPNFGHRIDLKKTSTQQFLEMAKAVVTFIGNVKSKHNLKCFV